MMDSGRVENGLIMVYTGNGKGKTSAALGSVTVSYTHLTLPTTAYV